MDTAHADQFEAACQDVKRRLDRMQADPQNGRRVMPTKDPAIHDALSHRLGEELRSGEVNGCCPKMNSPRVMYWVPRAGALLCDEHWRMTRFCSCIHECDACRLPIDEGLFIYLFMGPFIVQAMLCVSCQDRASISADGA